MPQTATKDRPIAAAELAAMLGYSRRTLKQMRAERNPIIADLPMFKICDCESTRRKTQARCNHPYYAWESDVLAFFRSRQERFESARSGK